MINNARQSGNPSRHRFLDDTVTYAKEQWAQAYADLQKKQFIQKHKVEQVTKLKQEMEALNRLIEKYEKLVRQEKLQKMQGELDELIIQKSQGARSE